MSIMAWGAEDGRIRAPSLASTASCVSRVSFSARRLKGFAETYDFGRDLFGFDVALGNAEPFGVKQERWTDGDARRNGDSAFNFHARYSARPCALWKPLL